MSQRPFFGPFGIIIIRRKRGRERWRRAAAGSDGRGGALLSLLAHIPNDFRLRLRHNWAILFLVHYFDNVSWF